MNEDFIKMWEELENLDETHFPPQYGKNHYDRHVAKDLIQYLVTDLDKDLIDPISYEEYDNEADTLSKEVVKNSNLTSGDKIIGFKSKDGKNIKFNTENNMMVVYAANIPNPFTISYYKTHNSNTYLKRLARDYLRELTPEDDNGNI